MLRLSIRPRRCHATTKLATQFTNRARNFALTAPYRHVMAMPLALRRSHVIYRHSAQFGLWRRSYSEAAPIPQTTPNIHGFPENLNAVDSQSLMNRITELIKTTPTEDIYASLLAILNELHAKGLTAPPQTYVDVASYSLQLPQAVNHFQSLHTLLSTHNVKLDKDTADWFLKTYVDFFF